MSSYISGSNPIQFTDENSSKENISVRNPREQNKFRYCNAQGRRIQVSPPVKYPPEMEVLTFKFILCPKTGELVEIKPLPNPNTEEFKNELRNRCQVPAARRPTETDINDHSHKKTNVKIAHVALENEQFEKVGLKRPTSTRPSFVELPSKKNDAPMTEKEITKTRKKHSLTRILN